MSEINTGLAETAKKLLAEGTVEVVIGYEKGTNTLKATPAFITSPDDAHRLIFDPSCVYNLIKYSLRFKGRVGIVVKACDVRAVVGYIQESQKTREDFYLIGVPCEGVLDRDLMMAAEKYDISDFAMEYRESKCPACDYRFSIEPDEFVGERQDVREPDVAAEVGHELDLMQMTPSERQRFFEDMSEKCIRCYACRQACPMCYCLRCIVDKNQPQWVDHSIYPDNNQMWHLIWATHLMGRCVGCGECERACPQDLPLRIIHRYLAAKVKEHFDYTSGQDPEAKPPLNAYWQEDQENFIR